MNIADNASDDAHTKGGGIIPPCTGIESDALPEVPMPFLAGNSHTGVSTRNVLPETFLKSNKKNAAEAIHWYVLRATYGREKKAYDYLVSKNVKAFYPTVSIVKVINGKRRTVKESRLPNLLFVCGMEGEIKSFVYDNINLPYLRFYYRHIRVGGRIVREPLVVPDGQIESLQIGCQKSQSIFSLFFSIPQPFCQSNYPISSSSSSLASPAF